MAKPKAWNVKVHRVHLEGAKLDETSSFTAPSWMTVDQALRFARKRLASQPKTVRAVSVGAPIEDRKILAYLDER